jgi:hypothetical protein
MLLRNIESFVRIPDWRLTTAEILYLAEAGSRAGLPRAAPFSGLLAA